MPTLADSLAEAARLTPHRVVLVDGDIDLTCEALHAQARVLARALLSRMPTGSVVSFMLPNWHEAAVIYLAATIAGIAVNPILPSLRDRELSFILDDVDSAMIFVPSEFRRYDYLAMVDRVTAEMNSAPEVVVLRGASRRAHRLRRAARAHAGRDGDAVAGLGRGADDPVYLRHHRSPERCSAQP